jgi:hypothetical protein
MLAWIAAGLVMVGFSTSALFRRHVEAQFHDELRVHLLELAGLTRIAADGRPYLDRPLSDPRFGMRGSGYYWTVERHGLPPSCPDRFRRACRTRSTRRLPTSPGFSTAWPPVRPARR